MKKVIQYIIVCFSLVGLTAAFETEARKRHHVGDGVVKEKTVDLGNGKTIQMKFGGKKLTTEKVLKQVISKAGKKLGKGKQYRDPGNYVLVIYSDDGGRKEVRRGEPLPAEFSGAHKIMLFYSPR